MAMRRYVNDRIVLANELLVDVCFHEPPIHQLGAAVQFLKAAHFARHVCQRCEPLNAIGKTVRYKTDSFSLECSWVHQCQAWRDRYSVFLDEVFLSVVQRSHRDVTE